MSIQRFSVSLRSASFATTLLMSPSTWPGAQPLVSYFCVCFVNNLHKHCVSPGVRALPSTEELRAHPTTFTPIPPHIKTRIAVHYPRKCEEVAPHLTRTSRRSQRVTLTTLLCPTTLFEGRPEKGGPEENHACCPSFDQERRPTHCLHV